MLTKDGRNVPILELTPENYPVTDREANHYHVLIEQKSFDQRSGARVSVPRIQKCGIKEWSNVKQNFRLLGYDIIILHDPLANKEENETRAKAAKTSKKAKYVAQTVDAEKDAMRAEIDELKKQLANNQKQPKQPKEK